MVRSGFLFRLTISTAFLVALVGTLGVQPAQAQTGQRCFPETGQCISGRFREYWEQNGGLAVFGYPITPVRDELNRDTNRSYQTQWFERNRFELHPENARPYDVLLGRLGDDMLRAGGRDWSREGRESGPRAGCLWFDATGHNVCDQASGSGFKTYWERHGLEFDGRAGTAYQESLALFGLPLTEPRMETNSSGHRVLTQWFERARFEYHPNNQEPYTVLLGLLGRELRGSAPAAVLPASVPWVHSGNQVIAAANGTPAVNLAQTSQFGGPFQVTSAPNGSYLAFVETISASAQQLVVLNIATGARQSYRIDKGMIFGAVFSPDSKQLAYNVIFDQPQPNYELRVLDLTAGSHTVLAASNERVVPIADTWNNSGLYASQIIFASDAPVQGIVQINPKTGAVSQVLSGRNYGSAISPDGRYVALVTGEVHHGPESPRTQLAVRDRQTGRETVVVPLRDQLITDVQWNASGTQLVYRRYAGKIEGPESVRVVNANGSGEQSLRLDTGAFPGVLLDVTWRGDGALLLLTKDGPNKQTVFEVALSNFQPAAARNLQTLQYNDELGNLFVYVPR